MLAKMHFCALSFYLLSIARMATAYWKGFNLPANLPNGACKSQPDWTQDFTTLQALPGFFSSARLYASSDCNTLASAVPAAIATGTTLLIGVWTENDAHFEAEKAALLSAVQQYGTKWLIAVSVGSEDLYRGDTDAATLSNKINDVRGMMCGLGACNIAIGHVDTWTAWVDPKNNDVIRAVDWVGTDGYPYFQASTIEEGYNVFWQSVEDTRNMVNAVKPGTWVWITETGWCTKGPDFGASVCSTPNAETYWKRVACEAFAGAHTFWYTLQDFTSSPSFGVVGQDFKPLYNLSC